MHILLAAQMYPHPRHSPRAANIVLFEMLRSLAATADLRVSFLPVLPAGSPGPDALEQDGLAALSRLGVEALAPLEHPTQSRPLFRLRGTALLDGRVRRFYPAVAARAAANARVAAAGADVVMTVWSEQATALLAEADALRFAYYGNPDTKSARARFGFERRHGGPTLRYLLNLAHSALHERAHLRVMRRWHLLGDVAANDAAYYRRHGHPNAFYVQNMWIDRDGPPPDRAEDIVARPVKIIANVGKLDGTSNTLGLEYLAGEVLPALRAAFGAQPFELHLLGSRRPRAQIAALLDRPELVFRGFVDDIDEELRTCDVFLCVNNATAFNVGHTRYLHAWSMGCCVIAADAVREVMPELEHRRNALLGADAHAIAAAVVEAARSPALRRELGRNGYATFADRFRAETVVATILSRIRAALTAQPRDRQIGAVRTT